MPLAAHRDAYLRLLADHDRADLILFREVERFGHCAVTPRERLDAFEALVAWVQTGVRPSQ